MSVLARVEVAAALWRKHRIGDLPLADTQVLLAEFEADWHDEGESQSFLRVAVTEDVLEEAARCIARHPLRAFDAVQLASAVAARAAHPDLNIFLCFDVRLATAAAAEGFNLEPQRRPARS